MGNGKGWLALLGVSALLLVGLVAYFGFTQQSAVPSEPAAVKEVTQAQAAGLSNGDAATLKVKAKDQESDSLAQQATELYVEEQFNGDYNLIADNTTLSATADTSVATKVGAKLKVCSFQSGSYYGDCVDKEMKTETEYVTVPVYAAATTLTIGCYKDASNNCSLSLGASETDTFDHLQLKQGTADSAFRVKAIAWNSSSGSNIQDISMGGSVSLTRNEVNAGDVNEATFSESTVTLQRRRQTIDWLFTLDKAVMLHQYDLLKTPVVGIEASSSNPSETIQFSAIDEGGYRSVSSNPNHILFGMEDDSPTGVDVGVADIYQNVVIK